MMLIVLLVVLLVMMSPSSAVPTVAVTESPTSQPSDRPSSQPSRQPSHQPSSKPSRQPSSKPSHQPTDQPTLKPSSQPTSIPSSIPTSIPTAQPTLFLFNLGNGINESNLVFILLSTGLITFVTVSFTLFVITFDKSAKKYTKFFIVLQNLLISGLIIAMIAVVDVVASSCIYFKNYSLEYIYCFFEYNSRKYFYQTSFLWTSLLAIHFLHTTIRNVEPDWHDNDDNDNNKSLRRRALIILFKIYDYPSYIFWLIALLIILPNIAYDVYSFATIGGNYNAQTLPYNFSFAVLRVNKDKDKQIICTSNPTTQIGRILDILLFELVLAITLTFNITIYTYSTYKIWMKSPSSVVERLMKKSAGYLIVQIIVWLPSFISNVIHIAGGTPTNVEVGFKVTLALNSLQGFLNCMIYIYTDRMFRKWMNIAIKSIYTKTNNDDDDNKENKFKDNNEMEIGMRETFSVPDIEISGKSDDVTINTVKSILHTESGKIVKSVDFDNKKFVKFKARPEIRIIGDNNRLTEGSRLTEGNNRLTENLLTTNRIDNKYSMDEKNS